MKTVELNCAFCNKLVVKRESWVKSELKYNPNYKPFCDRKCAIEGRKTKKECICFNCQKKFERYPSEIDKSERLFCSHHCAAEITNRTRDKISNIILNCILCDKLEETGFNTVISKFKCNACNNKLYHQKFDKAYQKKYYTEIKAKRLPKKVECKLCCHEFLTASHAKFCDICRKIKQQQAGIKSAQSQRLTRRSKNEIYFAELCAKQFSNVTTNQNIFAGWDADVLLNEHKIAILWNGPWHYIFCGGKHSLRQVQSRDEIKLKKIAEAGWESYSIKDFDNKSHGKYSKEFVEQEFNKLLKYMKDK
jgi:hypothetical protein